MTNKQVAIIYIKNKIQTLQKKQGDEYADRVGIACDIQILKNALLIIKGV